MVGIIKSIQNTFYALKNRFIENQRGQSLTELALLLPILLMLAVGTVDIGMGFRTYITLTNSAREGVRWITLYPDDPAGVTARITEEAARRGLSPGAIGSEGITIDIAPNKAYYNAGDEVTVTVSHEYALMFGSITGLPTIPFQGKAKMVVLYNQ